MSLFSQTPTFCLRKHRYKRQKAPKQSPPPTAHFFIERQPTSNFSECLATAASSPFPNNSRHQYFILFSFYGAVVKYARRSWCIWNTIRSSWKWGISCNKLYIGGHCSLFYHPHTLSAGHVKVLVNCCCKFCWRPIKMLATKEEFDLFYCREQLIN